MKLQLCMFMFFNEFKIQTTKSSCVNTRLILPAVQQRFAVLICSGRGGGGLPTIGGSKWGTRDALPLGPNSFTFMQFKDIFDQIIGWYPYFGGWHPLLWEILDLPLPTLAEGTYPGQGKYLPWPGVPTLAKESTYLGWGTQHLDLAGVHPPPHLDLARVPLPGTSTSFLLSTYHIFA